MRGRTREFGLLIGLAVALVACALTPLTAAAAPPSAATAATIGTEAAPGDDPACQLPLASTFHYTGEPVYCTVPSDISSLTVTVIGGHGGSCPNCGAGGNAGEVVATVPVQPGDPIKIWVGGQGTDKGGWGVASGGDRGTSRLGYNGAGGGGASGIGIGTGDGVVPIVVGGGGGGGGGNGYGANGEAGGAGGSGIHPPTDGHKGADTPRYDKFTIGIGGSGGHGGVEDTPAGGDGGSPSITIFSAGGGGGGGMWHGGGGGGSAGAEFTPVPGAGGGGGGGGDSGVAAPADALLYTDSAAATDGVVTLTTDEVVIRDCTQWGVVDIPEEVRTVQATVVGGQGGGANGAGSGRPGFGARVDATIHLNPAYPSELKVAAGCAGTGGGGAGYGTGGWQGTAAGIGYSGGGGGGGSVIENESGPVIVAGGGGGAGGAANAADSEGGIGGDGGDAGQGLGKEGAGDGGNGRGFDAGQGGDGGGNGSINGQNGEDAGELDAAGAGGGGGGGFIPLHYGGGIGGGDGGALAGGGGGGAGASYAHEGTTTEVTVSVSGQAGDGFVLLRWQNPYVTHITIVSGDRQTALVGTEYAQRMTVAVTDQNDQPMPHTQVIFFAPSSGASGTFPDDQTIVGAVTDGKGIAVAPPFVANDTPGTIAIDVGNLQGPGRATFSLENVLGSNTASHPEHETVVFGQPNTDAATVTSLPDGSAPTGTVDFALCGPLDSADGCETGGVALGAVALNETAPSVAAAVSPAVAPDGLGSWCYRAAYSGDDPHLPSVDTSAAGCFTVTKADTTTTLTAVPDSPREGASVTLIASVSVKAPGKAEPTGTVTFAVGGTVLGTADVDPSGEATVTVPTATAQAAGPSAAVSAAASPLPIGTSTVTATYSGDGFVLASQGSAEVSVVSASGLPVSGLTGRIPIAAAVLLLGIGTALLLWKRQRRSVE